MALTGLAWFGFLVTHVVANLNLFRGPAALNGYAAALRNLGPLLIVAEVGLFALIAVHIVGALRVTTENAAARPQGYTVSATRKQATFASRTMILGGFLIVAFLLLHVKFIKFGPVDQHPQGLWGVTTDLFKNPGWVAFYLLSLAALGLHLGHGLSSALQSLGVGRPGWREPLRKAGLAIAWLMILTFMSMPIWGYLR